MDVIEQVKTAAMQAFEGFKAEIAPTLGKMDAFDAAKFAKMEKSIGDAIELSQKEAAARKAAEDQQKALEKDLTELKTAFNRVPNGAQTGVDEKAARLKFKKALNDFARTDFGQSRGSQVYFDDFVKEHFPNDAELKALSVGQDPSGGYLVTPEIGGVIQTKVYESSPMRALATVLSIGTMSYEHVLDNDEAGSGWTGETSTRPTTNSQVSC